MDEADTTPNDSWRRVGLCNSPLLDTPLEERFERVTRLTQRMFKVPIAALSILDVDRQWFKSIQGLNVAETSRAVSFCACTVLSNAPLVIPDARLDPRFAGNPLVTGDPHIVFYAGCPVRARDGSKVASLCVIDRTPRHLTPDDLQALKDLAAIASDQMSAAMECGVQAALLSELDALSREARVDPLTRVWNRTGISEIMDRKLGGAGGGVAVLMVDLDHFKHVNDSLGHAAGDEVLRQAGKRILSALRGSDALGRFGGEEFVAVLSPCEGIASAAATASHVLRQLAETPLPVAGGAIAVTASVGVAYAEAGAGQADALVRAADEALYRAKRGGRNRVELALISSPSPSRPPRAERSAGAPMAA